jgi:hypothetical protein
MRPKHARKVRSERSVGVFVELREARLDYQDPFRVETHSYGIPGVNGYAKVRVSDQRSGCYAELEGPYQPMLKARALETVWDKLHEQALAEDADWHREYCNDCGAEVIGHHGPCEGWPV